jgi:hypothetical protein
MISETLTLRTFYNQQGEVDHVQFHVSFFGEITNSATGETFRDHVAASGVSEGPLEIHRGLGFNIVRPGQGPVFQLVGRRFVEAEGNVVARPGPADITSAVQTEDFRAAICAALE